MMKQQNVGVAGTSAQDGQEIAGLCVQLSEKSRAYIGRLARALLMEEQATAGQQASRPGLRLVVGGMPA